ncbi:MAG: hypothetical protein A2Z29_07105 [Chloroflexi bacterium RBG_16_56_11]|nr:MAG: hypothetical protein A2Z29_07105 [Chloroflexi bacterium RBG_16_56_11]
MFTAVPPTYDLVNRVITLGMDRRWRGLTARACLENSPRRVLDVGCGTGDLTIALARLAGEGTEIVGIDYSLPMLERARQKAAKNGVVGRVRFVQGEATALPYPDVSLDCVGISFAFRNLTYRNPLGGPHLAEVARVLRDGGRYVVVESSQPLNPVIRALFHFYLRAFVRPVGTVLAGNPSAYRYLSESAARFYPPREVREMLLGSGFRRVGYRPLFFGAAGIHVATK